MKQRVDITVNNVCTLEMELLDKKYIPFFASKFNSFLGSIFFLLSGKVTPSGKTDRWAGVLYITRTTLFPSCPYPSSWKWWPPSRQTPTSQAPCTSHIAHHRDILGSTNKAKYLGVHSFAKNIHIRCQLGAPGGIRAAQMSTGQSCS